MRAHIRLLGRRLSFYLPLLLLVIISISCKNKKPSSELRDIKEIEPKFAEYVTAITSGVISSESTIKVILASNAERLNEDEGTIEDKIFSFDPKIEGTCRWLDYRTIEFIPSEKLSSGTFYNAEINLGKLIQIESKYNKLEFNFQIIKQNFSVSQEGLNLYPKRKNEYFLEGKVLTADVIDNTEIETLLIATHSNKKLPITWQHSDDRKEHRYQVDSIIRKATSEELIITWDGKTINVDDEGSIKIEIPAISDFKILNAKVFQYPEQYVKIQFSDPINTYQNVSGLIYLSDYSSFKYSIEDNIIRAYPESKLTGKKQLIIEQGVKNVLGDRLKEEFKKSLTFTDIKPAVELIGDGVIMPNSEGLIFPFKAVNLSAVDVEIIKIYESNIPQFLQVNKLDGIKELRRVGRKVYEQQIDLKTSNTVDFSAWNTYSIDLAKLVENDPGAMYRVSISFKRAYSLYGCEDIDDTEMDEGTEETDNWDQPEEEVEEEDSYWDYYEEDYDYDYQAKENPCNKEYYNEDRMVSRNVLASNLGIIAKSNNQNTITATITDLRTLEPQANVEVELYNYQNQLLTSVKTDANGIATLTSDTRPFLLVAKKDAERGYLRLFEGSSLSLTWFDIGGSAIQKGIKGYIYGERGVWRPGDTVFLNFILEDKLDVLPDNHPVSFELINPLKQIVDKQIKVTSTNSFYHFRTVTDADAPTGNWIAKIKVGGAVFEKILKIETVKPNRLKIKIDFGVDKLVASDDMLSGNLELLWLHGAVANNLRAKVTMTLNQTPTRFGKYSEYIFDDPSRKFETQEDVIFDRDVNDEGKAKISANISVRDAAPGMLRASFKTMAFEEGGEFSIDQFSIPYSPYNTYVGVKVPKGDAARNMLLTDEKHKVDLITCDANGNLVSRNNIKVKIYKIEWRWWWDSSEDDLGKYSGNRHYDPIFETTTSTKNGRGDFEFEVKYPSWGRYLVKVTDAGGHSTGKVIYIDWPGWAGKSRNDEMGGASILSLATDKRQYNVGETAEITIPEAPNGRALVSIESGSKVVEMHWVQTSEERTIFKLPITEAMSPNVYINVNVLQPHGSSVNDAPLRLYGYTPITVVDPKTKLVPVITMADELKSESKVTIKVSEKYSKQMTYTLAVVDEGLLDLTRFGTPDPWHHFYAREALGITTWDMYDMVLGAYGGHIEKTFGIGGGDDESAEGRKKADRFKPVVKFMGPFTLDMGKTNTHTFTMPKYIGSVRAMVVAGYNGAYGSAEKTVPVKNPLMVLATLPRVLSPGETVKLPVTVFAMDEKVKKTTIRLETNDILQATETQKELSFSKVGDKVVDFGLKVKEAIGVGKVKVIVTSGSYKAEYDIQIDVRNPNPYVTEITQNIIEAGQSWTADYTLPGIESTNKAVLEVTNMPPIDINKQLMYLIKYPHGCIEQTTSSVFPQLFLGDVVELSKKQKKDIENNISAGIKRLHSFQLSNGGLGYWPNATSASDWGTTYAGHFLIEAEKAGYDLPSGLKSNWIKFQKSAAKNWKKEKSNYNKDDLQQAYRLYTLALAGEEDYSSMNRLKEQESLSVQAKWRLAAAYALAGQPEKGVEIIEGSTTEIADYNEMSNSFGSSTRDRAMILESLVLMKKQELGIQVLESLSKELTTNSWHSTQTTAYCLIGISKFFKGSSSSDNIKYSYTFRNNTENVSSGYRISSVNLDASNHKTGKLVVENKGSGIIYARLIMEGQPLAGDTKTENNNLKMNVVYKDMDNNVIDINSLSQGTDFKAEVTVSNPGLMGDYENMALSVIFPSGWEIHNSRLNDAGSAHVIDVPTYQDIRDDRVYTYFDLPKSSSRTYTILLNSSYMGKFYLPTIYCEAMYDVRIHSRLAGKWVEVKNK